MIYSQFNPPMIIMKIHLKKISKPCTKNWQSTVRALSFSSLLLKCSVMVIFGILKKF
ncbi:Protein of unknown function [Gryllus bimaculatus]|nr:Protein of unknown function [Gryllus bimaculatus]